MLTRVKLAKDWVSSNPDKTVVVAYDDFTPTKVNELRIQLRVLDQPVTTYVVHTLCLGPLSLDRILSDESWMQAIDPSVRIEDSQAGNIGQLFGMSMITDVYEDPSKHVLERNDLILCATSLNDVTDSRYLGITLT